MIRVAVDLAGSEKGAEAVIAGARKALEAEDLEIMLVGPRSSLPPGENLKEARLSFVEAPTVIPMGEKVNRDLFRKRDSSLFQIVALIKEGKADAAVSAGNTACFVALAITLLETISGVDRPGIAIFLPKISGITILIDAGANTAPEPAHLLSYARMGAYLYQAMFNTDRPRVGLLNVGHEETKGNILCQQTSALLKAAGKLNFVGNVEGVDLFNPEVDVVVTDGFTGNCILKACEGILEDSTAFWKSAIRESALENDPRAEHLTAIISRRADFAEHTGGLLMGVRGLCTITHGRSGEEAHYKSILRARHAAKNNLIGKLQERNNA